MISPDRQDSRPLSTGVRGVALVALGLAGGLLVGVPVGLLMTPGVSVAAMLDVVGTAASWYQAALAALGAIIALLAYQDLIRQPKLELRRRGSEFELRWALKNIGNATAKSPVVIVQFDDYVFGTPYLAHPAFSTRWTVSYATRRKGSIRRWRYTLVRWGGVGRLVHAGSSWLLPPIPIPLVLDPRTGLPKPGVHSITGTVSWTCEGAPMKRATITVSPSQPMQAVAPSPNPPIALPQHPLR